MPKTGETCQQSGIYKPNCCEKQIALSKNEKFPPCRDHPGGPATWTLVQPTK